MQLWALLFITITFQVFSSSAFAEEECPKPTNIACHADYARFCIDTINQNVSLFTVSQTPLGAPGNPVGHPEFRFPKTNIVMIDAEDSTVDNTLTRYQLMVLRDETTGVYTGTYATNTAVTPVPMDCHLVNLASKN